MGSTAAVRAQTTEARAKKAVRGGFVGVGSEGSHYVGNLMRMEGVELRAVCDIVIKTWIN